MRTLGLDRYWLRPDRRPIYDWAHDHVEMPPAVTIRGRFDVHRSRRLIGPFEALASDTVREENVLAPVRGGKSLIADVWVPWIIENDAGPIIWNFQKDQTADEHCETRLWPILLACDPIRKRLDAIVRNQKRTSEIIMGHMFIIVQGPALSNLQSKGCRYLINDECWQYPPGRMAEAYGRVDDFLKMNLSKILNLSQASEPGTEWHDRWLASSRHCWWIACQKCQRLQYPAWSGTRPDGTMYGMRWDEYRLPNRDWNLSKCLPTVRWECAYCGHPHVDCATLKREWNRTGAYEQTNPDARPLRYGHHWNAIVDYPWVELAERFMESANAKRRGSWLPMIQFFQKQLAQFMSEAKMLEQSVALPSDTYDIKSDWPEEHARFFTVDRQKEDTYWGMVGAWSKDGEFRRLWFGFMTSAGAIEEKRIEFNVPAARVLVDSGHESKDEQGVYEICADHGWAATKGSGYQHFVNEEVIDGKRTLTRSIYKKPIKVHPQKARGKVCWLFNFASSEMKDRVRRMQKTGKWKEPDTDATTEGEVEYRSQMTGEFKRLVRNKRTGVSELMWYQVGPNHAFDCAALQCLAATICGILPNYESQQEITKA